MKQIHKVLSIQVNLNGLSFCILNRSNNNVEHLHEVDLGKTCTPHELLPYIKEELSSKTVFSDDFTEVVVIHQNELATIVPNELFLEKNSADYLKYNSKILKSDYISHDDIDTLEAKNVYVPYVNINNYIFDTFGQFTYKHSLTVYSEAVLRSEQSSSKSAQIFINVNDNSFELVVTEGGKVLLTNIHNYFSKEDFIYYVLFTFEQLDLDPNENSIHLTGKIDKNDDLFNLLFTYVRHVDFTRVSRKLNFTPSTSNDMCRHFLILNSL